MYEGLNAVRNFENIDKDGKIKMAFVKKAEKNELEKVIYKKITSYS